ncbi:TetR/AcrR family transcriptional regulator [Streptomyces hoynatensis]|uniref:TetR/AcrR family transcriptional regulator n=1 Tax=Streptomyces hoynatensis TaxID=1141874 RepID=UPI0019D4C395|nr:TetR/AcrR family transcriptional regulator [Streptomyces hoynatensis]
MAAGTPGRGGGDIGRSLALLWQGRERPSRGPKPGLTLEGIVRAAVGLADREGIDALSMRKVAAELGVGTMTLYRYVPGKAELLQLMLDHVHALDDGAERLEGAGWRAALQLIGEGAYRLHREHPWLLQVNQARPLLGPSALRGFEFALASLEGLGLRGQEKIALIMTLDSFVTGLARYHVLLRQATEESGVSDEDFWAAQGPVMELARESGRYPHLFGLPADAFELGNEEALRFGLHRILDGVEALIAARRHGSSGAPPGADRVPGGGSGEGGASAAAGPREDGPRPGGERRGAAGVDGA